MEPDRNSGRDRLIALSLAAAASVLYLVTAPGVVNLDGLGYLKLLPHNFAAGHLLYMPLLRGAVQLLGGDPLRIGRLVNALLGGTGVLLTYDLARRVAPLRADRRFVAIVAAVGLMVSYGYWAQGNDVEVYALATVALLAVVRVGLPLRTRPSLGRTVALGVVTGLAVLCHLTHVLCIGFVVTVCLEDPRGRRHGITAAFVALSIAVAIALAAYAYAAMVVRGQHLDGAIRWVLTAQHGFHEHPGAYAFAQATYGLARSLVWSPYLYEADAPRLLGQFLFGLAPILGLIVLARRHGRALSGLPLRAFVALGAPYAAFALVFFGADPERWIFILPLLWIVAAVLVDALGQRRLVAAVVVGSLLLLNLFTAIGPQRTSWKRHLAEVAAAPLADGDLVVFPGHDWDEYISYYARAHVEPFPISYYAARDGVAAMWARFDKELAAMNARGGHLYVARVFDDARDVSDEPAGYVELRGLGVSRAILRDTLGRRFIVEPLPTSDGVSVVRLTARD
jgi:hypothetical protein